jgi:ATP-dependent RNA helicase DOB1
MVMAVQEEMQVIVFSLGKRQCEELAGHLKSVQLNSGDESTLVERIFWSAMDILSPEDRRLPQISNAVPMLQRGIGVHHSGLLPIVKEVIEVLFGEGLIKVRHRLSLANCESS